MPHKPRHNRRPRHSPLPRLLPFLAAVCMAVVIVLAFWGGGKNRVHVETQSNPPTISPQSSPTSPSSQPTEAVTLPWNLTLVNASHPLPEDFKVETTPLSNGLTFDTRAYEALIEMLEACRAEGLEPIVCSAYRSVSRQTELFENKLQSYLADGLSHDEAYAAVSKEIAVPGTSEHSLGLAVDICALSYQLLDEAQANTAEQQWLMSNCHKYGFILRYPKGKSHLTGIIYEPWHYRYVGKEAAAEITNQGLCLEEYLELYT